MGRQRDPLQSQEEDLRNHILDFSKASEQSRDGEDERDAERCCRFCLLGQMFIAGGSCSRELLAQFPTLGKKHYLKSLEMDTFTGDL